MVFTFLETLNIEIDLTVLRKDSQPYSALLYQHEGNLHADDTCIRNNTNAEPQLLAFLKKSLESNADLALTPEYCCPWTVIEYIIKNQTHWPRDGKLWAYGCEAITKQQIQDFRTAYTNNEVHIHFDNIVLQKDGNYLDPLVYIFRGSHNEQPKLIILIQFKTAHMGVWTSPIERDNYIGGEEIYVLRNSRTSIHFFSLICSEAMNFQDAMVPEMLEHLDWDDRPYLIFNPQLNPNPTHDRFCRFKEYILRNDRKELITLNWTAASKLLNHDLTLNNSSRSGFYMKSVEADLSHRRIKQNHALGMYYFSFGQNKHAFVLNSIAHAFLIHNAPVSIVAGLPEQQRRDGPRTVGTFTFNATNVSLETSTAGISDSHLDYLKSAGCTCTFLNDPNTCILEKEMLVSLTSGNIKKIFGKEWSEIHNLYALQSDQQTEINRRITFTQDSYESNEAQRRLYLETVSELEHSILTHPELFPESIKDLGSEVLRIGYTNDARNNNYRYNVITAAGEGKIATICYMGHSSDNQIVKAFDNLRGIFDNDNNNKRRVVIFYKREGRFCSKYDAEAGSILSTNVYGEKSIIK